MVLSPKSSKICSKFTTTGTSNDDEVENWSLSSFLLAVHNGDFFILEIIFKVEFINLFSYFMNDSYITVENTEKNAS